jgi:hypothetical protein
LFGDVSDNRPLYAGLGMPVDQEKLAKLAASVRTGGKGSVRRKKKAVHKTATTGLDYRFENICFGKFAMNGSDS